jgi:ABC-type polysaccharide/polyol phosphate transport system ATPase subunit
MKIVTFEHVSKRYRLSRIGSKSIREELAKSLRRLVPRTASDSRVESDELLALDNVSFEVERGETVGIIGPNGSGKSTVLKLLARITYPTSGKVMVLGSTASLIEVGAGFHPELSGRENIYLYGSIMGMRSAEVRAKFDRIVEFSELQRFIDTPVKRYSSGMYVRLGFAVAAHVTPQVLLVDEVLAVGDAAFRTKCLQRIEALRRSGTTIVFVSHDMSAVERLCKRAFFLHQGRIRSQGEPQKVIRDYLSTVVFEPTPLANGALWSETRAQHDMGSPAEVINVRFLNGDGEETDSVATGDPFLARLEYRTRGAVEDPVFELHFYSADDRLHCQYSTALSGEPIPVLRGNGFVEIVCDELGLKPGVFRVEATLARRSETDSDDRKPRRYLLNVLPGKPVEGMFYSPHRWRLVPLDEAAPQAQSAEEQCCR